MKRMRFVALVALVCGLGPAESMGATPEARMQIIGDAERYLPEFVSRKFDELQATSHPDDETVLWGCRNCRKGRGSDVFMSQKQNGEWVRPSRALFSLSVDEDLPSFSVDGGWLYYVSDRRGGFGGTDLYRISYAAHRKQFTMPENLGPSINSAGDEGGASATADGLFLVFASAGRPGARGWDLFSTRRSGGKMTPAQALPNEINSEADEFDPVLIGDSGLVFARSSALASEPSSLWFAPRSGSGYGAPVRLDEVVNRPGTSVRGAALDLADPQYLLFTRSASAAADGATDIYRVRFRVVTE